MRSNRLHVGGFSTGPTNFAVNLAGAVPFAVKGDANGFQGYNLIVIVKKDSPYKTLADLKGKKLAHTSPSSNSGNMAPIALFPKEGLVPGKDYEILFSGKHDQSVMGVNSGDYDAAAVASDVFYRMAERGQVKEDDFRIIYTSEKFPTSSFAYAYDLEPSFRDKMLKCFYDYRFPAEMQAAFRRRRPLLPGHLQKRLGDRARRGQGRRRKLHPLCLRQSQQERRSNPPWGHRYDIKGLVKEYKADQPVLKDINLDLTGEGLTAIIGPSGTGQKHAFALHQPADRTHLGRDPAAGRRRCRLDLANVRGARSAQARRRIGMVFQEYNLVERLTVMENLLTGRLGYTSAFNAWRRHFEPDDIAVCLRAAGNRGPGWLCRSARRRAIGRTASTGGHRPRADAAASTAAGRRTYLVARPEDLGRDHGAADRARPAFHIPVIVNIHDVELARRYATRIIGMSGGRVVYDGDRHGLDTARA